MTDNDQANDALELGRLRAKIAAYEPIVRAAVESMPDRDDPNCLPCECRVCEAVRNCPREVLP